MDAIDTMELMNVSAVGVEGEGSLSGLFTRSDFIKRVLRRNIDPRKISIFEVMTFSPVTISLNETVKEAYRKMKRFRIRHLPVVEKGTFFGIVTDEDINNNLYETYKNVSEEYNVILSYINGESYGRCAY